MNTATKIVFVDGFEIRNTLEDDFGIVERRNDRISGEHPKFWIPRGEVWVDHCYRDEAEFLVEMDEFTYPTETESYQERRRLAKQKFCTLPPGDDHLARSEPKGELVLRYVDGGKVRRRFDPEFVLGGHGLVYDYIPKNEIWLDDKMDRRELPYIYLHEELERKLMTEGKPYHIAHEHATVADKELRRQDGFGSYPGDPNYAWWNLDDERIIREHYVIPSS